MNVEARWSSTKEKQASFLLFVQDMPVKDKRKLFNVLRGEDAALSTETFLPLFGLHCGEFAYYHILADHARKGVRAGAKGEGEVGEAAAASSLLGF